MAREFAEAQREVYGMLGLSVPPTGRASFMLRRRTLSDPDEPTRLSTLCSRPMSESFDDMRVWSRKDRARATRSVVLDDVSLLLILSSAHLRLMIWIFFLVATAFCCRLPLNRDPS